MRAIVLLSFLSVVFAKHENYTGWKAYSVTPSTEDQRNAFYSLENQYELDVLQRPTSQRDGLTLVPPQHQEAFENALNDSEIQYNVYIDDVKAQLDLEDEMIESHRNQSITRNGGRQLPYDSYQELEAIYTYIEDIAARYPQTVKLETRGTSFEGRPLYALKISTTNFQDFSKPVIFIDAGIHSREWISIPAATWVIRKLVEDVTDPDLLERFDWIVIPVVNPDGYRFSFSSRFWRKTRSTDQHSLSQLCPGVDGNRNYDFFWATVGTSASPCTEIFPGGRPFSEAETRAVRDVLIENRSRMALYITIHSFGSYILYPWGHNGALTANGLNLHLVGVAMAQAIDAVKIPNFPNYIVGNSALALNYQASGGAEDYAHSIGIPLAYTYELPGPGSYGFVLPPRYIENIVTETWEGIKTGARLAGNMFNGPINPW